MVATAALVLAISQTDTVASREELIYGRKLGVALTLDKFTPAQNPNGAAILLIVSSGWGSSHSAISLGWVQRFTKRGYTVFAIVHSSAPKFYIPEIIPDIHRAARYIRSNAESFNIDPQKLGATGASAGAHLTLVLATQCSAALPEKPDDVDQQSSAIQAAACFFPPTDFNNFVGPSINALDESVLKNYRKSIGPIPEEIAERDALGRSISPIYSISSTTAPTLIFHGDKDPYVLLHQSSSFVEKLKSNNVPAKLVVKTGESHGWADLPQDIEITADWFDHYLLKKY